MVAKLGRTSTDDTLESLLLVLLSHYPLEFKPIIKVRKDPGSELYDSHPQAPRNDAHLFQGICIPWY
jgi:hypothetical protein